MRAWAAPEHALQRPRARCEAWEEVAIWARHIWAMSCDACTVCVCARMLQLARFLRFPCQAEVHVPAVCGRDIRFSFQENSSTVCVRCTAGFLRAAGRPGHDRRAYGVQRS